jgi:pimeloyl-ACP methyl ester carboxylesterase
MRYIYLHGFASGPSSTKADVFREALAKRGAALEVPELDGGDFAHLTISGQLGIVERIAGGNPCRLVGSSMGGYLAALYTSLHPEVDRLVLLAPAFALVERWPVVLGEERFDRWRREGWIEVHHYGTGRMERLHNGLYEDAMRFPPFPAFPQPTLVFHGVHDDVVPVHLSREFVSVTPNARLLEMDSDHQLVAPLEDIVASAMPFLTAP